MSLIYYLTHVHIDFGTRPLLASECERVSIKKPLIVTDAGVSPAGVLQMVLNALPASLQGPISDRTPSNPTEAAVREAAAMFNEHGCDGLIAVGGGSSLDCANGVAAMATPLAQSSDEPPPTAIRPSQPCSLNIAAASRTAASVGFDGVRS